jgi:hypothetical protein
MRSARPTPPPSRGNDPPGTQSRGSLLAAGARRFATLLVGIVCVTAVASLLLGLAFGASANRSISLGLYLAGSFLLVAGFFIGNRGPARLEGDADELHTRRRRLRWASRDERVLALNESAIFVTIGFVLILLGVLIDARVKLL